ncbi:MAG: hypothetical protein U0Y82_03085 [Thermoleophilia bacterium]
MLAVGVAVTSGCLIGMAFGARHLDPSALMGLAAVAGLVIPPITAVLRGALPGIADGAVLRSAYGMEAALQEVLFIVGPVLVVLAGRVMSPDASLVTGALMMLTTTLVFAAVVRRHVPGGRERASGWALASGQLRVLVVIYGLMGLTFGLEEIAAIAVADRAGHRGQAGMILAVWSVGSMLAGLASARYARGDTLTRLRWLLVVMAVLGAPLYWLAADPVLIAVGLFAQGAVVAPALAVVYEMIPGAAPPGLLTEAFAWGNSCVYAGIGAGNALSGTMVSRWGPQWAMGAAFLAPVAAVWASRLLRGQAVEVNRR